MIAHVSCADPDNLLRVGEGRGGVLIPRKGLTENFNMAKFFNNLAIPGGGVRTPCSPPLDPSMVYIDVKRF